VQIGNSSLVFIFNLGAISNGLPVDGCLTALDGYRSVELVRRYQSARENGPSRWLTF
jgi:hypothetical protein